MPKFHSQFHNPNHKFSNFPPIFNAYKIPPNPHILLTNITIESMEVKTISPLEHDNKENIPPFSSSKKPGPNEEKPKCNLVKRKKKWIRRPLRDVTNFYRATELWGLDPEVQSPVSVSVFPSSRKRKAVDDDDDDDDEDQRICSKILRREFR